MSSGVSPVRRATAAFTVADAIGLRVPLCFVVEPDLLWADRGMDALLAEYAAARESAVDGSPQTMVARWTLARRWTSYGAFYGFGLAGSDEPVSRVDPLEELLRLADHLASARRTGGGIHLADGGLLSIRGLQAELDRPITSEVLLDLLRELLASGCMLLVELERVPVGAAAWRVAASLGPVAHLPGGGRRRYESAIREIHDTARVAGVPAPDPADLVHVMRGLTQLQADLAARMVRAHCEASGAEPGVLDLLRLLRRRVIRVFAGAGP